MHPLRLVTAFSAALLATSALYAQTSESAAVQPSPVPTPEAGVRIVRLSQVEGKVQLDRAVDHGYETAFANLPIVQGSWLKTNDGIAEVEFEDNSSMRMTPGAIVQFSQLTRDANGGTVSGITVIRGTVYVSLANTKVNTFALITDEGRFNLLPASHIKLQEGAPRTELSVIAGSVEAHVGTTTTTVTQKKTLQFDPAKAEPVQVSHLATGAFDNWDKNATMYHKQFMNASTFGGSGLSSSIPRYGLSDLNYYGSFSDSGCGSMWRPYFANASWNPYGNGIWAAYQGAGYSWVSPYPWGWTPYHSGSWDYCPTQGWGWRPGNNWVGLSNAIMPVRPKQGPPKLGPPNPPVKGASLIAVNTQPISLSRQSGTNTFLFANNSAGWGVPRQTFGKLGGISSSVARNGSASTSLFATAAFSSSGISNTTVGLTSTSHLSTAGSSFSSSSHGPSGGISGGSSSGSSGSHR